MSIFIKIVLMVKGFRKIFTSATGTESRYALVREL